MTALNSTTHSIKLTSGKEMQALDRRAIDHYHIPSIVLMENAGLGTVRMLEQELGPAANTFALIFIGPGNNGGDGLVIARHLHQRGCHPVLCYLVDPTHLKGDASINVEIATRLQLEWFLLDSDLALAELPGLYCRLREAHGHCYAVLDALFGIGLTREISNHFATTIQLINKRTLSQDAPVIAVDIPSGLDADSGQIRGFCIQADHTATYGCAKSGQVQNYGQEHCGRLHIIDIGIPPEAISEADIQAELITDFQVNNSMAAIRRRHDTHKGSQGHLLIAAGSAGKTGAAILCAQGALRSGCGLVSCCAPHSLNQIFETTLLEAMTVPLPHSQNLFDNRDLDLIKTLLTNKQALVLGPGLGTEAVTADLILELYETIPQPMVVDADALNVLATKKLSIKAPPGPRIFTPHPGEMARLLDLTPQEVQYDRISAARQACTIFDKNSDQCVMVLKGAASIVTASNGQTWINSTGNPGMASGGMGDVLSGLIGGLLCQGLTPLAAATTGVFIHGRAGDLLASRQGIGYTASDLACTLPHALTPYR
ncbi:MAG: NAD(P)H-hydrate dehydratase [Desulfobulbaceae bacterium]|uniref:Bifunctional NAD(P)H-hydrate repair enzyme n=1 Tax=Candidatus Desulfatifera sulfidica TaxID=2841691 RepID=A0A8J6TBG0_9BACT|nr:NAD(P)H-hydrate dehydratase [Candidatus Desulfatifera sulfidica]